MKTTVIYSILVLSCLSFFAHAEDTCKKVRFADVGWTDISVTTALASEVLKQAGFETKINSLSVPITFMSLKNRDIDIFLGNWMPSMKSDIEPYLRDGSIESIATILKGAKYTLAVPRYVQESGITSIEQLKEHSDQFKRKIYGIEPGNEGNTHIQQVISDPAFGLNGWKIVESSEQAMLSQVAQAYKRKEWIVFLGWEPHPMNQKMELAYLNGASQYFGPNQGESTVYINTRKNYSKECPQVANFLKQFSLTLEIETALMKMVLEEGLTPSAAAKKWLKSNPSSLAKWSSSFSNSAEKSGEKND